MEQTPQVPTPQLPSVPRPQTPREGGLDFRKLAKFIGVLGVVVACYGTLRVMQNQPLPPPPKVSTQVNSWSDFARLATGPNSIDVMLENIQRRRARAGAFKIVGVGALIGFVAFAIGRSAERPQE